MHRRRFLELVGRLSAAWGVASPLLAPATQPSSANTEASKQHQGKHATADQSAPALVMPLDTEWFIVTDPDNVGRSQGWFRARQLGAKATRVPSIIQEIYPAYHGLVWYWLEFKPELHPYRDGRYLLRFNAVDYLAHVWLNGTYLGAHEGGETPFVLDATHAIHPGENNIIAVRVLNPDDRRIDGIVLGETPHRNKVVNFSNGNFYDFGGIIAPVELLLTPSIRIKDLYVSTDWKTGVAQIQAIIHNTSARSARVRMSLVVTGSVTRETLLIDALSLEIPSGDTPVHHQVEIKGCCLWDLDNPCLYRLTTHIESPDMEGSHEASTNFGFRDFRVVDGYFRLNGRRVIMRCTHTGNNVPFGQVVPPSGYSDLLRRDLLYAKASGFNTVRFISGIPYPYQLNMCDELGLMVYEESSGSWLLKDSPQMKTRYESSVREMVLRDRNHPSVVVWGLLNETLDGPVFLEAESALKMVRSLDETRLILLSSGRFDGHLEIGSASNPGGLNWETTWGKEAPGAGHVAIVYPSGPGSGDFHLYPSLPQTVEVNRMMRTFGEDSKPVFLSEYGIGSMMDVIHEAKMYEQAGIPEDAEDFVLIRSMAERLSADWSRFSMDEAYPNPEVLLQMSQLSTARHRLLGFNLIRSNPKICGFNLTGMLDHAMTGEGVWRFWRDWKPGAFDAMRDGWAPVRWCLFVEPTHTYVGRPISLEAVLANEDVLRSGEYPVQFRVWGPSGTAWERQTQITVPSVEAGKDGPLALPVLKEEVILKGAEGTYEFVPYIPKGIAPPETSWQFHLSDPASLPRGDWSVATWHVPRSVESWLISRGLAVKPLQSTHLESREVILVGDVSQNQPQTSEWKELAARMTTGSTIVFLSPKAFARGHQSTAWLPLANKGRAYEFPDQLYHKECVAKRHPVFAGLQGKGILDWYYYGPMLPSYLFDGQDTPSEVIAAAFAAGYSTPGGYASGVLLASYKFGAGQFFMNTFPILDYIDKHPVADRLLINLIKYTSLTATGPSTALPADFQAQIKEIGYTD